MCFTKAVRAWYWSGTTCSLVRMTGCLDKVNADRNVVFMTLQTLCFLRKRGDVWYSNPAPLLTPMWKQLTPRSILALCDKVCFLYWDIIHFTQIYHADHLKVWVSVGFSTVTKFCRYHYYKNFLIKMYFNYKKSLKFSFNSRYF